MVTHYAKKALKILWEEGPVELFSQSNHFIIRQIIDSHPYIRKNIFIHLTMIRGEVNRQRYNSFRNPFEPIWINPDDLKYASPFTGNKQRFARYNSRFTGTKRFGLGQVFSDDWKINPDPEPLMMTKEAQGLKSRFEHGEEWENTAYLDIKSRRVDGTVGDVVDACEKVDDLYNSIKNQGYKPNFTKENPVEQYVNNGKVWHGLEPLVVIGPDGFMYLDDGYHRVIISKILGVDTIPVNVLGRHQSWVRIKETNHSTPFHKLEDELIAHLGHPDIQNDNISKKDYLG